MRVTMIAAALPALLFALPAAAQSYPGCVLNVNCDAFNAADTQRRDDQRRQEEYQQTEQQQQQQQENAERQRRDDVMRYYASPQGMGSGPYSR